MLDRIETALFTAGAGAVNAGAFLACRMFVSHMTGTATQVGLNAHVPDEGTQSLLVLGSFLGGAAISAFWLGRAPSRARARGPLYAVALSLVAVALAGTASALAPFGNDSDDPRALVVACVLAGGMGLFNAAISQVTQGKSRVTHLSGSATDLPVDLVLAATARTAEERRVSLRRAVGPAVVLSTFVLGAILMVRLAHLGGYASFLFPAALLTVGASLRRAEPVDEPAAESTAAAE